jgi:adenosylhomocysteine nucleosidase
MGVVAALDAEARTLGPAARRADGLALLRDGTLLAVSGIGGSLAAAAAGSLADAGAQCLMSFGLAGGLDPALIAGAIVLPSEVVSRDGLRFATAADWREQLKSAIGRRSIAQRQPVISGTLLSSAAAIDSVADKAAAFRETGAVAVDMESLAIARVAAARGLPFIAVRVIVDTAADALPRAVVAASGGGPVNIGRLIAVLAIAPGEIVALLRLARRYRAATRALAAVAAAAVARAA